MALATDFKQYTIVDFRKSMSSAFASAKYQDAIVQINNHGKPWVAIVSTENASTISQVNSIGTLKKSDLGKIVDNLDGDVKIGELINRLTAMKQSKT